MGKYAWRIAAKILEFENLYISDNTVWRECGTNGNPFDIRPDQSLPEGQYPIYTLFFKVIGIILSFDPLLLDFLRYTRFHIGQLTHNIVRIVLGTVELNIHYNQS